MMFVVWKSWHWNDFAVNKTFQITEELYNPTKGFWVFLIIPTASFSLGNLLKSDTKQDLRAYGPCTIFYGKRNTYI